MPNAGNRPAHVPIAGHTEGIPWAHLALYSLLAALAGLALYGAEQAFAQPQDAQDVTSPRTFHRGVSESLSVASTFASPSAPAHYARTMTESINVQSAFPAQTQQAVAQPRAPTYSAGANQRIDERVDLTFKSLAKRGDSAKVQAGTPYQYEELVPVNAAPDNFDDAVEGSGEGSDPDDSSNIIALAVEYGLAQQSLQNASLVNTGTYGVMLVGALALAAASRRHACLVVAGPASKVHVPLVVVLVIIAAGSASLAADPSAGQAFADTNAAGAVYRSNTGTDTLSSPKYREWNPSTLAWSAEVELPDTGSAIINAKLLYSPTTAERVIVTLSADGTLNLFACDNACTTASNWSLVSADFADIGTPASSYRYFEIAYEQSSGDLVIVYGRTTTSETDDFFYRIYSDGSLSGESGFGYVSDGTSNNDTRYFNMASAAGSDEITMILLDATTADAIAMIWDGSSWGNVSTVSSAMGTTSITGEAIGVAYESSSGASVVFAGNGANSAAYKRWTGSWSSTSTTDPNSSTTANDVKFVTLKSDPVSTSNKIMICQVDDQSDLTCRQIDGGTLSGSGWTSHDTAIDSNAARPADFAWNPSGSTGLIVWGTASGSVSRNTFNGGTNAWGTAGTTTYAGTHPWIVAVRNPTSGDTVNSLWMAINSNLDMGGMRYDGSTLTLISVSSFTADTTVTTYEAFGIDFQKSRNIKRSISDSVIVAPAISREFVADRTASEALSMADSLGRVVVIQRSAADSLAASDTLVRSYTPSRSAGDSVALADSTTRAVSAPRQSSDSLSVSDGVAVSRNVNVQLSDSLTASDSAAKSYSTSRSLSDVLAASDSVERNDFFQASLSDALAVSAAAARSYTGARAMQETVAASDATEKSVSTAKSASDAVAVSDEISVSAAFARSIADSAVVADDPARQYMTSRAAADALAVADSTGMNKSIAKQVSDSLSVADAPARAVSAARAVSDSLEAVDEVEMNRLYAASLSDGLAVSDALARAQAASRTMSDDIDVADAVERNSFFEVAISDALDASDALARRHSAARPLEESLTAQDAVERNNFVQVSVSDDIAASDSAGRTYAGTKMLEDTAALSDAVERNNFVSGSASEALSVSDGLEAAMLAARPAGDTLSVTDAITTAKSFARSVSDSVAPADDVERNNFASAAAADSIAVSDAIQATYLASRSASDAVALADSAARNDFTSVSIADGLAVDDAASPGYFRSIADNISAGDEITPPVTGSLRQLSDAVAVGDGFGEVSVQWNRSFEEEMNIGDCTPFACNPMLNFDESLSLGDAFAGPPGIEDSLSIVDSIAAGRSFVPAPEETLSVQDSSGFALELVPPASPEGVPELGAMAATGTEMVGPLPAQAVTGTYSMETGNADDLADQLGLPTVDISAITDWSQLVLVLQTYYVALTPSYLVPADDSMMTVTVAQIPAGTPVLVPVSIEGTSETSEHIHIPWMTVKYTPAVDSDNFALLIIPLEQPPDGEPAPSADMVPLYLDVKWVGDFSGAEDPSVASYYAEAPTFTFALTDEWADSQNAERDENGVPVITLRLLDESTGMWQTVTDIDAPSAANDDGEYVYVAHLEHFSTYAVTAEEAAVSGGGGGGGRDRFAADLEESLAVSDSARVQAIGIIEEPGGVRYSASMQETISIASRPVAYKVLPVREDLDVLIALQQVAQHTGIPPSAKATFEVNINNSGDLPQSFTLKFWYNDDKGVRAFESSQEITVGARESRQELVEVVFTSPGTFDVTVEARSVDGMLLNTAQMTVEVPWLTVNIWLLVVVALSIIGESAAMVLYLLRRRKVAVAAGGQTVVLPRHKTRVSLAAWPANAKASDVQVSVRIANAAAKRALSGTLAEVEFEIRNTADTPQELILTCWFDHGPDNWYQRVQLGPHGSDLRRAEVSMPSRGRHMLHVEARDTEYGELLGMLRIGALSY